MAALDQDLCFRPRCRSWCGRSSPPRRAPAGEGERSPDSRCGRRRSRRTCTRWRAAGCCRRCCLPPSSSGCVRWRRLRLEANVLEKPRVEQPLDRGRKRRVIGCPQMVKKGLGRNENVSAHFDFSKRLSQGDQRGEYQKRQGASRIALSPRPLGGTALALLRRCRALHTETTAEEAKGLDDRKL